MDFLNTDVNITKGEVSGSNPIKEIWPKTGSKGLNAFLTSL